ncbi:MAG: hypothetical protein QNK04_27845 [Myxococcota bacterium]|nr:hypothetical protein [Myxococcota bacterium]
MRRLRDIGRIIGPKTARALPGLGVCWLALACAEPGLDWKQVEARHPTLAATGAGPLRSMRPYYLPVGERLTLFTCRWPDGALIPVELPADATADEARKVHAALAAWEDAGLGVRFERRALQGVGVAIEFPEDLFAYDAGAVVDCAVEPRGIRGHTDRLPARLVKARVRVARNDPRLVGTLLHELGHALGFQGHAPKAKGRGRRGSPRARGTIMRRDTELLREAGERVLEGEPFHDPSLAALYALPSGTVLGRLPISRERTRLVDRMLEIGLARGLVGPLVRVGDEEGRIAWLDPENGRVARLLLRGLEPALRDPERLEIEPSSRVRALLEGR